MSLSPTQEAAFFDDADGLVETAETPKPVSTLGMQARKRAIREGRMDTLVMQRERAALAPAPPAAEPVEKPKRKAAKKTAKRKATKKAAK